MSLLSKLKKVYKDAAVNRAAGVIGDFIENNSRFEGTVNITIIKHQSDEDLKKADNDNLQRLTLNAKCLDALLHKDVCECVRKRVLSSHRRVQEIHFDVSKHHATARVSIINSFK